jgi:phytoene/squalene synthetase
VTEPENAAFLASEAKKYDYDRWLDSLFTPLPSRTDIHALLTFNAEISKVRETVSEALLGDIRFQWWRDALNNMEDAKYKNHPVLQGLRTAISRHVLNIEHFEKIVDARSKDLDPCPFGAVAELLAYAEETGGTLNELAYRIRGFSDEQGLMTARQVGKVFALTGIIRAIPYHASQDLILIPTEIMNSNDLTPETVFMERNRALFFATVQTLTNMTEQEHQKAAEMRKKRPKSEKSAFSILALNKLYLLRLQKAKYDPAHPCLEMTPARKILTLFMA